MEAEEFLGLSPGGVITIPLNRCLLVGRRRPLGWLEIDDPVEKSGANPLEATRTQAALEPVGTLVIVGPFDDARPCRLLDDLAVPFRHVDGQALFGEGAQ